MPKLTSRLSKTYSTSNFQEQSTFGPKRTISGYQDAVISADKLSFLSIHPVSSRNSNIYVQRSASFSKKKAESKKTQNSLLQEQYSTLIYKHLQEEESQNDQSYFLESHQIQADYRSKMVDWMVEVLETFNSADQTFFLAVNLMDRYFKNAQTALKASDLHLTGLVSMFIASKYEDVMPIRLSTLVQKVAHNCFSAKEIEKKELEILQVVGFKIGAPTLKEFLDKFISESDNKLIKSNKFQLICMNLAKLACYNYQLMQVPVSTLAGSIFSMSVILLAKEYEISHQEQQSLIKSVKNFGIIINNQLLLSSGSELWEFFKYFEIICPKTKNMRVQISEIQQLMKVVQKH